MNSKTWKDVREEMGLKSYEMAELLNITKSSYSRKEKGVRVVRLNEATIIANKYFEITGKYLDVTKIA